MIYQSSGRSSEAMYFLAIQKNRTKLTALDNFQAMVTGGDAIALAVRNMIEESGYKVSSGKTAKTVGIVNDIYKMMKGNAESTRRAWRACVRLFGGNPVTRKPFQGFCRLDEHLQNSEFRSIDSQPIVDWIGQLTVMAINDMIEMKKKAFNKTGPTVYAEAIIELLNSKRRKKIESLYAAIVGSQFKDAV
jgi:hypothetical protein